MRAETLDYNTRTISASFLTLAAVKCFLWAAGEFAQ